MVKTNHQNNFCRLWYRASLSTSSHGTCFLYYIYIIKKEKKTFSVEAIRQLWFSLVFTLFQDGGSTIRQGWNIRNEFFSLFYFSIKFIIKIFYFYSPRMYCEEKHLQRVISQVLVTNSCTTCLLWYQYTNKYCKTRERK